MGVFGEVGVADACVREQRWARIVITLGNPATSAGPTTSVSAIGSVKSGWKSHKNSASRTEAIPVFIIYVYSNNIAILIYTCTCSAWNYAALARFW